MVFDASERNTDGPLPCFVPFEPSSRDAFLRSVSVKSCVAFGSFVSLSFLTAGEQFRRKHRMTEMGAVTAMPPAPLKKARLAMNKAARPLLGPAISASTALMQGC